MFEDRADIRYFLSRLAHEVRRGRLEIHTWCIMTTHYHLLVRSPTGELSEALRRSQNEYSRFFNRRHRRDGPLMRGRFFSKPVSSVRYRIALVRYLDANPVQAGLAGSAAEYEFGSAYHYARDGGPPWMERSWVESEVRVATSNAMYRPEDYARAFPALVPGSTLRAVAQRIERGRGSDALDSLVDAAPQRVRRWLERKARLADGMPLGQPVCDAETIRSIIQGLRGSNGPWSAPARNRRVDLWDVAEVALLRDLAGLTWSEIAAACGTSTSTSHGRYQVHGKLLTEPSSYADLVPGLASQAIDGCWKGTVEYGVAPDSSGCPGNRTCRRTVLGQPDESGATPYSTADLT